jgi:hypothetical protein
LKKINLNEPDQVFEVIKEIERLSSMPVFELADREDIEVKIRADEKVGPAKFKADPLIPGGYLANSLTIRAMRADIFVLGDSLEDLSSSHACTCGEEFDVQFWKICPYCGRDIKL